MAKTSPEIDLCWLFLCYPLQPLFPPATCVTHRKLCYPMQSVLPSAIYVPTCNLSLSPWMLRGAIAVLQFAVAAATAKQVIRRNTKLAFGPVQPPESDIAGIPIL